MSYEWGAAYQWGDFMVRVVIAVVKVMKCQNTAGVRGVIVI